jgi:hypothetical protein
MKKVLLFTMLIAVASLFTSCESSDSKLVKNLKGSWEGTTLVFGEETPVQYQFFESTDGKTGKFVEETEQYIYDTINGEPFAIPYWAYVCGKYSVEDGWLDFKYEPETSTILFDEDYVLGYINAFLENDRLNGEGLWAEETPEDLTEYFLDTRSEDLGQEWSEICEEFNNAEGDGFSNLTVDENTMSFAATDMDKIVFKRTTDMFDKYPFED